PSFPSTVRCSASTRRGFPCSSCTRERSLRSEPSIRPPLPRDEATGSADTEERGAGVIRPRSLRPGSRVAVVAPAGPVDPALLAAGVRLLESWGLEVEVGKHVLDRHPRLPYLAGRDADRAAEFQRAWCDPAVDAVLCARGGYGCLRMVDLLDWPAMLAA